MKTFNKAWGIDNLAPLIVTDSKTGQDIARCYYTHIGHKEAKVNAQLISAAPDLLQALKEAKEEIERLHYLHFDIYEGKVGEPVMPDSVALALSKAED